MNRSPQTRAASLLAVLLFVLPLDAIAGFVNFESGHVRPLALSDDGSTLFAVNTSDAHLSVFSVTADGLALRDEVPVGLDPVAVATRRNARGNLEAWVVDHVSDDVSVIELFPDRPAHVTRLLHVGDEPRDIVFAGHDTERAFITTAHRGQFRPSDPQLTTPGIPRADVWVFEAADPGPLDGGTPLTVVELFGDTPRALARAVDGRTVYVAVFNSGNGTTTLPSWVVSANGGLPPPPADSRWFPDRFPEVGLIVKVDAGGQWRDELGRDWSPFVPFSLPDYDVFTIDADAPVPLETGDPVAGVGTTLYALAVRPGTGEVFVANVEARNHLRFEPVLRGHLVDNRVTVITNGRPLPVDLNPHIDRSAKGGDPAIIARSLAIPTALEFSPDGAHLFVAAFGSQKIARLNATALAGGGIVGEQVTVGAGPSGLVLDPSRDRLYVMNQLDHTITVVAGATGPTPSTVASVPVGYDPTPADVRRGRPFLYDAAISSAYGDASCASCHVFGDMDHIAWDLGDPYGKLAPNRNKPVRTLHKGFKIRRFRPFHPMKGPMTTQSLRGMAGAGPMHWRGDRTGADVGRPMDERAAFMRFNRTFVTLLGRPRKLKKSEMVAFADFVLGVRYPPNPIAPFDGLPPRYLSVEATRAVQQFGVLFNPVASCASCHFDIVDRPTARAGRSANPTIVEPQQFKAPHLRNQYQKVGAFGVALNPFAVPAMNVGPQVRGFGFLHDGSVTTIRSFLDLADFSFPEQTIRDDFEQLLLQFPTGFLGHMGRRRLLTAGTYSLTGASDACGTILHTVWHGRRVGMWLGPPQGLAWILDRDTDRPPAPIDGDALAPIVYNAEAPVVFECVPAETARRLSIDRDDDGVLDGDEDGAPAVVP